MKKQVKFRILMSFILVICIVSTYEIHIIMTRPPIVKNILKEYGKNVKLEEYYYNYNEAPTVIMYIFSFRNTEYNLSKKQVECANAIRKMIEEDTRKNEKFFDNNINNDMSIFFKIQDQSKQLIFNYSLDNSLDKTDKLLQVGAYGGICNLSDLACISDMSYLRFNGLIDDSSFLKKLRYLKRVDFCDISEEKFQKVKKELDDSGIAISKSD